MFNLPGLPPGGDTPHAGYYHYAAHRRDLYGELEEGSPNMGGFAHDDVNAMMLLSNSTFRGEDGNNPGPKQRRLPQQS